MKNFVKIILGVSFIILIALLFLVYKNITGDNNQLNPGVKGDKNIAIEDSYLKNPDKLYEVREFSVDKGRDIQYEMKYIGTSQEFNTWYGADTYLETETSEGLFFGSDIILAYPVEVGHDWKVGEFDFIIESAEETVTTPAGTFEDVVKVKTTQEGSKEYSYSYYAKGVGQILRESVDENGEVTKRFELLKISDK